MLSATRRHAHVVNLENVVAEEDSVGHFGFQRKPLWREAGGRRIACTWFEVPPGKQAVPHHFHSTSEEAIYILDGKGAARIDSERIPIAAGDYVTYPPGPATAHSIINTGDVPLRYLCLATVESADIVMYPDSKKIYLTAGKNPSDESQEQAGWVDMTIVEQASVDYYHGELDDSVPGDPAENASDNAGRAGARRR